MFEQIDQHDSKQAQPNSKRNGAETIRWNCHWNEQTKWSKSNERTDVKLYIVVHIHTQKWNGTFELNCSDLVVC